MGLAEDVQLRVALIVPSTEAEGPGKRFAVWFQGCPLRCPGCCNPEFLPFKGGDARTLADMTAALRDAHEEAGVEGVSLLGGEPFAHAAAGAALADFASGRGLSVMIFSGYTIEQIRELPDPESTATGAPRNTGNQFWAAALRADLPSRLAAMCRNRASAWNMTAAGRLKWWRPMPARSPGCACTRPRRAKRARNSFDAEADPADKNGKNAATAPGSAERKAQVR